MSVVPSQPSRPLQYAVAIRESGLPSGVKATCWAIATFANNKTGRAYPTRKRIAEAVGLSEETVSKHTGVAEAEGYLRKDRKFNSSVDYYITIPAPAAAEAPVPPVAGTETELPQWRVEFERWRAGGDLPEAR
ncbi:helix-turn-helix domain-containing protein [Pseudarthrobacter sp. MDT3-1]